MADLKISQLTAISVLTPATDVLPVVDVSGVTKKIQVNQILGSLGVASLASATITGDLTVDTSTLKVDSANNRVGIGTATPNWLLTASGSSPEFVMIDSGANGTRLYTKTTNTAVFIGANYSTSSVPINFTLDGGSSNAMTLNSTGLGVGVTPSAKLHINGDIRIEQSTTPVLDFYTSTTKRALIKGTSSELNINSLTSNPITFTIDTTERARIDASGNLLVGKTASSTTVAGSQVQPDGTHSAVKSDGNPGFFYNTTTAISGTIALFRSNGVTVGSISQDGTNTAYNNSSDYRLKESVQPLTGGLARVNALKPSIYKWKTNGKVGEGFLAHELAEVVPFAVTGEKDAVTKDGEIEPQQVDLSKVVPILVAAIKELSAEVNALKNA